MKTILGTSKHYKGNLYQVIGFAKHTETLEELVVYHLLNDKNTLWVRPTIMFEENITLNGQDIPRFSYIK
jgi:hypothetical protein